MRKETKDKGAKSQPPKPREEGEKKPVGHSRGFIANIARRIALLNGYSFGASHGKMDRYLNPGALKGSMGDRESIGQDVDDYLIFPTEEVGMAALCGLLRESIENGASPVRLAKHFCSADDPLQAARNIFQMVRADGAPLDLSAPIPEGL